MMPASTGRACRSPCASPRLHGTGRQSGQARAQARRQRRCEPDLLYGAIEVGGTIRSTDAGEHWENLSHGQYRTTTPSTCTASGQAAGGPARVFGIGRAGMSPAADGGDYWRHVPWSAQPQRADYCVTFARCRGTRAKLRGVAAGGSFQSRVGGIAAQPRRRATLEPSRDGAFKPPHTMFALAFDERQPERIVVRDHGGEV